MKTPPARLRALPYYLRSARTLAAAVRNWPLLIWDLAGLPLGKPYRMRLRDGTSFWIRSPMDAWIVKEVYFDRDYQRLGVALEAGWTVLDIGAHIGAFTVRAAREAPGVRVHAFEPAPDSYTLLRENVALNRAPDVTTYALALAAVSGRLTLYTVPGRSERNSTLQGGGDVEAVALAVEGVTLSDAFERCRIQRCDFLKLDCEGAEFDILLQAPPALFHHIRHICLEYHDGAAGVSHGELLRLFADLRLRTRHYPSPVHPHLGFIHAFNPDVGSP
jgi:FkbM family methyltransferase